MFKHLIFDLDGTLLDTIPDIASAVNDALKQAGYDYSYDIAGVKTLIGDGADILVHRALRDHDTPEAFQALKEVYMPLYRDYQNLHTKPFDGLTPVLDELISKGYKLYIASNKPDALAQVVVRAHYGERFSFISGQQIGEPVKPNPIIVNRILDRFALKKEECLYIGDSHVDIETASNAGISSCLVTWGYGCYTKELCDKATYVIHKPEELIQLVSK